MKNYYNIVESGIRIKKLRIKQGMTQESKVPHFVKTVF